MISREEIAEASARIGHRVRHTPVIETADFDLPAPVWLKLESLQYTGSFKLRGAFNAMLAARKKLSTGVVTASNGNHGAAVAYAAAALGTPARVFVPTFAIATRVDQLRGLGATVDLMPTLAEARAAARAYQHESGAVYIDPDDQIETVAGHGTVGMEIEEQMPRPDTVLVPVGGGGLIGGIAAWFAGGVRMVAVESDGTATLATALKDGPDAEITPAGIAASALGASRVSRLAYEICKRYVDRSVIVSDAAIVKAQRRLWDRLRLVAEPGGVAALAALTSGAYLPDPSERIMVVICGANADPNWFLAESDTSH